MIGILREGLADYGIELRCYIDRIHVYCDAQTRTSDLQELVSPAQGQERVQSRRLPKHADMVQRIWWSQPSVGDLRKLRAVIKGNYLINYLELALDFCGKDEEILERWRGCLEQMLVWDRKRKKIGNRFYFQRYEASTYFAERTAKVGMTFYSDRLKGQDVPPVHLELRFKGLPGVRRTGAAILDNLIEFDHEKLWTSQLDLRRPNWTVLGNLLPARGSGRHGAIKRAKRFMADNGSLQELLAVHPCYAVAFTPFTGAKALTKFISSHMHD